MSIVIFIDQLNFLAAFRLLSFFLKRNAVASINYRSTTKWGLRWLHCLKYLGWRGELKEIKIDYSTHVQKGGGLWHQVHAVLLKILPHLVSHFNKHDNFLDWISEKISSPRKQACLRHQLSIDLYRPLTLMLFVQEYRLQHPQQRCVICFSLIDLFPLFIQEFNLSLENVEYINIPSIRNWIWPRTLIFCFKLIKIIMHDSLRLLAAQRSKSISKPPNSIAVQYSRHFNSPLNDCWWFSKTKLDSNRFIIFFNRGRKNPAKDDVINTFQKKGYGTVILDKASNQSTYPVKSFGTYRLRHIIPDVTTFLKILFLLKRPKAARWQKIQWMRAIIEIRKIQAFMDYENIKVIMDTTEFSVDYGALAADIVGGIKIGMHWSDVSFPLSNVVPIQQVYCVWGPRYADIFQKAMSAISEAIVLIGNIFDQKDQKEEGIKESRRHREKLQRINGVKHIIGIFDRSCGWGSLMPPPYHIEFYDKLLAWAEADSSIGLIIKFKDSGKPRLFQYPEAITIVDRILRLEKEGRLISLDGHFPPMQVSYASDLIIALGPNSAGIVSALEGARTIFWDPSGLCRGPLKEWAKNSGWMIPSVVFDHMDDLIQAAKFFLQNPSEANGLGDLSPVLFERDCFRDTHTADRLRNFVELFIEAVDRGTKREEALKYACQQYSNQWGDDKVRMYSS